MAKSSGSTRRSNPTSGGYGNTEFAREIKSLMGPSNYTTAVVGGRQVRVSSAARFLDPIRRAPVGTTVQTTSTVDTTKTAKPGYRDKFEIKTTYTKTNSGWQQDVVTNTQVAESPGYKVGVRKSTRQVTDTDVANEIYGINKSKTYKIK